MRTHQFDASLPSFVRRLQKIGRSYEIKSLSFRKIKADILFEYEKFDRKPVGLYFSMVGVFVKKITDLLDINTLFLCKGYIPEP